VVRQARADSVTVALAEEKAKRMKQIAKVYEQMTPASVAAIVANMPETDAVAILSRMTPRGAAKILSVLDPEKAARFSLELAQ
jgi:flagellar motility protein MotE (MotC chaperone)